MSLDIRQLEAEMKSRELGGVGGLLEERHALDSYSSARRRRREQGTLK